MLAAWDGTEFYTTGFGIRASEFNDLDGLLRTLFHEGAHMDGVADDEAATVIANRCIELYG